MTVLRISLNFICQFNHNFQDSEALERLLQSQVHIQLLQTQGLPDRRAAKERSRPVSQQTPFSFFPVL
jgi:hypothetical protein